MVSKLQNGYIIVQWLETFTNSIFILSIDASKWLLKLMNNNIFEREKKKKSFSFIVYVVTTRFKIIE